MRHLPPIPKKVKGSLSVVPVKRARTEDGISGKFHAESFGNPEIEISELLPPNYAWQAFFHELIHLMELEGGFELKDKENDSHVDRLAYQLLATFLRNGWTLPGE